MARYRKVDVRVWTDEKFRRLSPMPPSGQGLWLYLLTNPQTNAIPGLYRAGEAAMAEELGWSPKGFRKAFAELSAQGMAKADWTARVVWLPNALAYNKPDNPNVVKSWGATWDEIPDCALKAEAHGYLKRLVEGLGKGLPEAFAKACALGMANQEQEQEQDQEQEKEQRSASPPGVSSDDIESVWGHYKQKHPRAALDGKLAKLIAARLEDFSVADLKAAIDGYHASPFHCGQNERNTQYLGLGLILRDAEHVTKGIEIASAPPTVRMSEKTSQTVAAMQRFVALGEQP